LNKIVLRKTASSIFLAIVLVLGTITFADPAFMTNVQATSDREKNYDNEEEKKSYNEDRNDESRDNDDDDYDDYDNEDKSYEKESRDYNENDYDNDNYDKKSSYDKDSYDSKYSSYKDNYKSEYSSYEKDKSKDSSSSVSIKKIKCNNINANLNGIGVNIGLPNGNGPVTDPIAEAQALDDEGTESFVSNGESRHSDTNTNSRIICINNNDNTVVGEGGEEPISEICEECFAANSTLQTAIIDALSSGIGFTTTTFTEDSANPLISEAIVGGGQIDTLEKFCNEIENAAEFLGVPLSDVTVSEFLEFMIGITAGPGFESSIDELVECLLEKGLIVDREPFEPDSLSANGILSINMQCTGSPLCAKIEQQ
jgi:hypothetical protein